MSWNHCLQRVQNSQLDSKLELQMTIFISPKIGTIYFSESKVVAKFAPIFGDGATLKTDRSDIVGKIVEVSNSKVTLYVDNVGSEERIQLGQKIVVDVALLHSISR